MIRPRRTITPARFGFTLVELMISITIIAVLTTFVLVALAGVTEQARVDRTKAQISKINELLMLNWESYLYRRLPPAHHRVVQFKRQGGNLSTRVLAQDRLRAVREMMRMELPSHREDVAKEARYLRDPLTGKKYQPTLWRAYRARVQAAESATALEWTRQHEGAECLYLILSQMREADHSALEFFKENEIGDVDGDGMKEILDSWGMPIEWLRWAPGHFSPLQRSVVDNPESAYGSDPNQDDMFDPSKVGSGYGNTFNPMRPRALYPLIFSAGPDREYGIVSGAVSETNEIFSWYDAGNDPYDTDETRKLYRLGRPLASKPEASEDNVTNHLLTTR